VRLYLRRALSSGYPPYGRFEVIKTYFEVIGGFDNAEGGSFGEMDTPGGSFDTGGRCERINGIGRTRIDCIC
jgi:hypothetical protein